MIDSLLLLDYHYYYYHFVVVFDRSIQSTNTDLAYVLVCHILLVDKREEQVYTHRQVLQSGGRGVFRVHYNIEESFVLYIDT